MSRQWGGRLCLSSNSSEDGWPIQFTSRRLNLINSYYCIFIMLYWAWHKVGEDKTSALEDHCHNLNCHWPASCCSWTDGSESQCHWSSDFRNCRTPPLCPWRPAYLLLRCFTKLCLNLPARSWAWAKNFVMTGFFKEQSNLPLLCALGHWETSNFYVRLHIYTRNYSRNRS